MAVVRITQLPSGNAITDDDLLLVVDNPSGTAVTKNVSASLLRNYVQNQAAALQFRQGTDAERQQIVPASGEPIWTNDTNIFYIGNGSVSGGMFIGPSPYQKFSDNIITTFGVNSVIDSSLSNIGGGSNNQISNYNTSSINGGTNNSIYGDSDTANPGDNSCIAGGHDNVIGQGSSYTCNFIGGGLSNIINDSFSAIIAGNQNATNSSNCAVVAGSNNTAGNLRAVCIGGYNNTNSAENSITCGGDSNGTTGLNSITLAGKSALTRKIGEVAHANGSFSNAGDAQHSIFIIRKQTSDATANTVLTLDGLTPSSSNRLTIPAKATWNFTVKISAYNDTDSTGAGWTINGSIRRNGSNGTAILGTNTSSSWTDTAMSTASASVVADDTNEALEVRVTGIAAKNIRWCAVVDITQVSYGSI